MCDVSCYHPLKAVKIGLTDNGKDKYKIMKYQSDIKGDWIEIPCGKCVGCRLDHARMWADRCYLESMYHDSSYFLTLTYDESHIPKSGYVDDDTGEYFSSYTLRKKDFQLFMKRLRKSLPYKIRFYGCGEYGGSTVRPHYHVLCFGLVLNDLKLEFIKDNNAYYSSPSLSRVWDKGYVVISQLTYATCAYTARYVTKKVKQYDTLMFDKFGMEPEFTLMSRRPGIGRQFFDEHDCYEYDFMSLPSSNGVQHIYPSRYFDKCLDKLDPERLKQIKEKRLEMAKNKLEIKLSKTDNDYLSMLGVEEKNRMSKVNFVRDGIKEV